MVAHPRRGGRAAGAPLRVGARGALPAAPASPRERGARLQPQCRWGLPGDRVPRNRSETPPLVGAGRLARRSRPAVGPPRLLGGWCAVRGTVRSAAPRAPRLARTGARRGADGLGVVWLLRSLRCGDPCLRSGPGSEAEPAALGGPERTGRSRPGRRGALLWLAPPVPRRHAGGDDP